MNIYTGLLVLAAAVAAYRIYVAVRAQRGPSKDDWDERLVKNLRAQGGDPFSPYEIDFFFDLPNETSCETVAAILRAKDCNVDFRRVDADRGDSFTLHANRRMRVSVPEMQGMTAEMSALAAQHGGRYDGWVTAGITREVAARR